MKDRAAVVSIPRPQVYMILHVLYVNCYYSHLLLLLLVVVVSVLLFFTMFITSIIKKIGRGQCLTILVWVYNLFMFNFFGGEGYYNIFDNIIYIYSISEISDK